MPPRVARRAVQHAGELSAVLGAAYEAFLRARLERRAGRGGKVHARGLITAMEIVDDMIEAEDGHDWDQVWRAAISELERDRTDLEADVLAQHGFIEREHEWPAFLEWAGQVRLR